MLDIGDDTGGPLLFFEYQYFRDSFVRERDLHFFPRARERDLPVVSETGFFLVLGNGIYQ